jgi:zinc protease
MSRYKYSLTLLLIVAASWTGRVAAAAAAAPAGLRPVTTVEGISEYRLDNGLKVLLFPDTSKPTVTVNITYLVGSRHESYGETGMAHLLEHMAFKGTPKHTNIYQEQTEHGAQSNASTGQDRTNYFETFAATDANLRWALELEADRMVNSFIAKKDLDTEMTVVRNEFESGENDPGRVLIERVLATAYMWHNYSHSAIGSRADVENVPIERLQNFYKTYYQPDNAVLLIAGKLDVTQTLALVNQYFAPIARPARVLPNLYTAEPAQDGERSVALRRVADTQYVMAAYHMPFGAHADAAALDLMTTVLADSPSGRLYKSMVQTQQAADVFGFTFQLHDPGIILFGAQVRKDGALDAARAELLKTIDSLAGTPPTAEELERARNQQLKQIELALNNSARLGLALSDWIGMGDWRLYFIYRDQLRKVSVDDLRRVAATYLVHNNLTVGLSYATTTSARAEIPATPDVTGLVKDYKGDAARTAGEVFDASPANIDARTTRSKLSGGMQLALLSKKTRGESVKASLTLRFGDLQSLAGKRQAAVLTSAMLMRGTTTHTRQQLEDEFDRLKARVTFGGNGGIATVSIDTTRQNFAAVLTLVSEVLHSPSFPQAEFDTLRQQQLAGLEEESKDPTSLASTALRRYRLPYARTDIRYTPAIEEQAADLKAATLNEVRQFHQQFYGAAHGELAVVGDFDARAVSALAGKLFNGWNSRASYARVPSEYREVAPVSQTIATPDKANAFMIAAVNLKLSDQDADYPALLLGNDILGGDPLQSRIASRLRQKEGLSYDSRSQLQVSSLDQAGVLVMYAIYAPQYSARLEAAYREEMDRILRDGFTGEEIAAAKTGWLQSRQVERAQDAGLARALANSLYLGRTMAWDAALEQKVNALTSDQITAALRKHVQMDKLAMVKAGDFAARTSN